MKTKTKLPPLAKVHSIADLFFRADTDPRYAKLALAAASNLGMTGTADCDNARRWLETNAMETDEAGVVAEINFCRNLV